MKPIMFGYCIKKDRYIYGFAKDFNMLCCWDIECAQLKFLGSIPGENFNTRYLTMKLISDGDDIYIIPYNAEKLWIYNIVSKKWEGIELESGQVKGKFVQAFIYDRVIYMIGHAYKAIVKINLMTKETGYIREPYDIIEQQYNDKVNSLFLCDYSFKDEKTIYLPAYMCGIIFEFDLENESYNTHFLRDEPNGYDVIVRQDGKYWLALRYGGIFICWDGENIVDEFSVRINTQDNRFGCFDGYINGTTVTFYSHTQKMTVSYDFNLHKMMETDNRMVNFCNFDKDNYLLQDSTGVIVCPNERVPERYDVRASDDFLHKTMKRCQDCVTENITLDLSFWLGDHSWQCDRAIGNEKNNIGSKIWEEMKRKN